MITHNKSLGQQAETTTVHTRAGPRGSNSVLRKIKENIDWVINSKQLTAIN